MKHIKKLFCLAAVIFTITAIAAISAAAADSGLVPSDEEYKVLELVNAERAQYGLTPLEWCDDAYAVSKVRAEESAVSFSHTRPNGSYFSSVWNELGQSYAYAAENIAYGYHSAEAVVTAWMNSEGHRANILSPNVTYMAVALYGSDTWAQEFFTPYGAYTPENSYLGNNDSNDTDDDDYKYEESDNIIDNNDSDDWWCYDDNCYYDVYDCYYDDCGYYVCPNTQDVNSSDCAPQYTYYDYCPQYAYQPKEWCNSLQDLVPAENLVAWFGTSCK
ncbi:MAG: CAP domain-containing protein [Oscillospiraceae bacterium]|jgi:hypothetical protein|nr:CAP domain-containing protein [Oscillospiraceae bacterium]